MKKLHFPLFTLLMILALVLTFASSCCDKEESGTEDSNVVDSYSGVFTITNLSTHELIGDSANVINNDTLVIHFTPKQEYANPNYKFEIICGQALEQIDDSTFTVPKSFSGSKSLVVSASATVDEKIYNALRIITLNVPQSYISIPMVVSVSADLKEFVDVELSYTDKNGNEQRHLVKEEEWVKPDSTTLFVYKKENGTITFGEVLPQGATLIEEERYKPNCLFIMDARFYDLGKDITTTFCARYTLKSGIDINRENYELTHNIDRRSANIRIPSQIVIDYYIPITIDLSNHVINKGSIPSYLDALSKTPDIKRFKISTSGQISSL